MIIRIELNQLENRSGYYFFNDFLFTGEAYDHRDNQLYQVYEITDGMITGSRDYGFLQEDGNLKIDSNLLDIGDFDFDYEMNQFPNYYQGKPFTGLFYDYFSGFVSGETLCINGWIVKDISFYPDGTGRIRKYEENHIDITETTGDRTWSLQWENNSLKWIESRYLDYKCEHSGHLKLYFNEQEQIKRTIIEGDYTYVSLLVPQDDLPVDFKTFDELLTKEDIFAEDLSILSIDYNLLNQWLNRGLLNRVKRLEVDKIETKPATINKLAKLPSLDKLDYTKRSLDKIALVQAEKQRQIFDKLKTRILYCS